MSSETRHRTYWVARGIRQASQQHGIALPADYSLEVARDGLSRADSIGVTRLGKGVVLHTAPDAASRQLPIFLGYADRTGAWYRDGRRYGLPGGSVAQVDSGVGV